jgi:hypothetical protein
MLKYIFFIKQNVLYIQVQKKILAGLSWQL